MSPSVCETCGDGVLTSSNSECDDSNSDSGDGCSNQCIVEPNYICSQEPSVCTLCGDGVINSVNEACDDSNNIDGDGCSSKC